MIDCVALYAQVPQLTRINGRKWYATVRGIIADMAERHGVEPERVAAVWSALSPLTSIARNCEGTERFLRAYNNCDPMPQGQTLYVSNAVKAWDILRGDIDYSTAFKQDTKTFAFFKNLIGDEYHVTIDSHMRKALDIVPSNNHGLTQGQYREAERAIKECADIVNEIPAQLQAMLWIYTRGKEW